MRGLSHNNESRPVKQLAVTGFDAGAGEGIGLVASLRNGRAYPKEEGPDGASGTCMEAKNVAFGANFEAWSRVGPSATPRAAPNPNSEVVWLSDIHKRGMAWKPR
jgi:hypothetical protein